MTIVISPDAEADRSTARLPRAPARLATDTMRLPPAPRAGGTAAETELFVIEPHEVRTELVYPGCARFIVGASAQADVPLAAEGEDLDDRQLAVVRSRNGWLMADRGARDQVTFDGYSTIQHVTPIVSRTIVGVGRHWLVFFGACETSRHVRLHNIPMRDADEHAPHVEVRLDSGATAGSWEQPILIGTHERCDLRVDDLRARLFHGFVYWAADGVRYQPLIRGAESVLLTPNEDGVRRVEDCEIIFEVKFVGKLGRRQAVVARRNRMDWDRFVFVGIDGIAPAITLERTGRDLTVGRGACDMRLHDRSVSRVHALLRPCGKQVRIVDSGSSNGTFINGERVNHTSGCPAFVGDVVEFGNLQYRLEYGR